MFPQWFHDGIVVMYNLIKIAALILIISGCNESKRPFLIAQLCLKNDHDISNLINEIRGISRLENMEYFDNTMHARESLEAMRSDKSANINIGQVVDFHISRPDGMGLGVGNLGLPSRQVAIGFSEGQIPTEARAFARRVVTRLQNEWRVEIVPYNEGARPIQGC